ncbi:patatin-like phospholipase family protein [bacterium]|nr:patatin-like phospholipase family protein [bacterium]
MGLTIINKFQPSQKKEASKIALVLAGGAISGGAFKVGGLKALNDYLVNKKVTNFDIYVGLSAGAFLIAPLAGGIPPEEMLASLDGQSKQFSQLSPFHLYRPNVLEFLERPLKFVYGHLTFFPGIIYDLIKAFPSLKLDLVKNLKELLLHPSYSTYEQFMTPLLRVMYATRTIPTIGELMPSGLFDNSSIENFIRDNMKSNRMTNNFKVLKRMSGRSLYISAMDLDTSERVVFGPDEKNDVTISEAIQASTAIPGFYKPACLKGVDYIDGGVRNTANIDIAVAKGADLVICYNPFRPFNNKLVIEYLREENHYVTKSKRISNWGIGMIFNQVFRTLFHSRLMAVIQNYREDPSFKKDVILLQPAEDDSDFFALNPLFFWNRAKAASQGFHSVTESINQNFDKIAPIMQKHGLQFTRERVDMDAMRMAKSNFDDQIVMEVLEDTSIKPKKGFRVVSGGRR